MSYYKKNHVLTKGTVEPTELFIICKNKKNISQGLQHIYKKNFAALIQDKCY